MHRLDEALADRIRDVVIASRFQPGAKVVGVPASRMVYSIGAKWMFQTLFPIRGVRDYTCGYRAYRSEVIRRAYERYGDSFVSEPSFACMPDVLWKVSRLDVTMAEVPLLLFYEISIIVGSWIEKKREEEDKKAEEAAG